jgi:hypothetical protein
MTFTNGRNGDWAITKIVPSGEQTRCSEALPEDTP